MARDWNDTEAVRRDILDRMDRYGQNVADVPFAQTLECRDGKKVWIVDIHVKVRRTTEFEISGEGDTLADALRRAYLALNNEPMVLSRAETTNLAFGVAV